MNERILELAEQAGFMLWGNESWNPGDIVDWSARYDDELAKFAELIVKETITEMCQQLYWHGEDQSNNPSFYKAIDKTKKHFGVGQ